MTRLFRLGLVSISFRELSVEAIMQLTRAAGFEGIEWGGDKHVPHGDLDTAREVRRRMDELGLVTSAYGSYYRFQDVLSPGQNEGPNPIAALETASMLGAPTMRVWAGTTGSGEVDESAFERVVERCRELADMAEKKGMRIDFEFHENTLADSAEAATRLLGAIDHPSVGSFWQPPLGESHQKRLDGLRTLLPRVSNIHCNYFGDNPWPGMQPLENGAADWRDYLDTLENTGRPRWISIEHVKDHAVENFSKDAATLKRWVGR